MKKLLILSLSISLLILTTKTKADTPFYNDQPDLVEKPGDKAPFQGVLVNPDHYKKFTLEKMEFEDFKANENHYIHCDPPPIIPNTTLKSFIIGFFVGAITFSLASFAAHR